MKKKRIAALLLTAFLIVNEAVYPVDQYVTYAQSEPEEELNLEEGETEETVFSDQKNNEENSQEIGIEPEREEQDEKPGEGLLFSDGENTEGTQETGEGLSAEDGTILSENTDFVFDDKGVLTEYKGAGGTVVIPPDVTEIGDDVFKNNQTITAVEFPEGLKKIGSNAFSGCSGLEGELQLPDSLETIGINAFYNCNNITGKLIIPDGRVSLGARAVDNIGIREIRLWVSTDQTNWSEAGIGDSDFVSAFYNTEKIIFGNLWLRAIAVDTAGKTTGKAMITVKSGRKTVKCRITVK